MPWGLKRYYGMGSLHFITWSYCRRKPLLCNLSTRPAKSRTSRKEREKWGTRPQS